MGSAQQEGGSEGRGLILGTQQPPWCLSEQGKCWPHSPPFLHAPPHLSQGLPHSCWTSNHGWVPLGVGTPPLPQPPLRVRPLLLFPLPSLLLPQDVHGWRGPRWAEDQAQDLSRLLGAQEGRGNLATLPFDPLPSQWSPISPSGVGSLPLPQPSLRGSSPILPPLLLPPSLPPCPMSYQVTGGSSHPLRCPWSPTSAW